MEQIEAYSQWQKYLSKLTLNKPRFEGFGKENSIMFINANPEEGFIFDGSFWDNTFGSKFGKILEEAGIDKDAIWFTNLWKYATKGNRPLREEEIEEGSQELFYEINAIKPTVIVLLGKQVGEAFNITEFYSISSRYPEMDIPTILLPHPSYIEKTTPVERSRYLSELKKIQTYVKK